MAEGGGKFGQDGETCTDSTVFLIVKLDAVDSLVVNLASAVRASLSLVLGLCKVLALGDNEGFVGAGGVIVAVELVVGEARVDKLILGDARKGHVVLLEALDVLIRGWDCRRLVHS